jgi:hypothetical protein
VRARPRGVRPREGASLEKARSLAKRADEARTPRAGAVRARARGHAGARMASGVPVCVGLATFDCDYLEILQLKCTKR